MPKQKTSVLASVTSSGRGTNVLLNLPAAALKTHDKPRFTDIQSHDSSSSVSRGTRWIGLPFPDIKMGIGVIEAFSPIAIQRSACAVIASILILPAAQTPGRRGELAAPGNSMISALSR